MPDSSTEVLFETRGQLGLVTLNRPQALNALTLDMVRLMNDRLATWAADGKVKAVAVTGAGGRAFCSGGDVKAVALDKSGVLKRDFFREEYILNHRIHTFPKPYIALIDGICMGGGKGISAHGSHRVVTENLLFAMPETNIGFFPDVGGGYFLPRCPGQTGAYLALTSRRIGATDAIYIGFATHFVPADNMPALQDALAQARWEDGADAKEQAGRIIEGFKAEPPGQSEIAPHRERIDRCFGYDTVEEIIAALQKDDSGWARETLTALYAMSPTSLKVALRQIREGDGLDFARVMTMEYRLSQAFMQGHDFYEGIRAALIDKDRKPRWSPPKVADVQDNAVEGYFAPLGERDLVF